MSRLFKAALAALFLAAPAQAAQLSYDFSVDPTLGGTGTGEIRATFLEVLAPVRITSLGAGLAQLSASEIDAAWTIYRSNANDDVLDAVVTADADFSFAGLSDPVPMVTTAIDAVLNEGYYLFTLLTQQPLLYSRYYEPDIAGELPFITADGAIRVIEGGILQFAASDPSIISGNVALPAIQVGYDVIEEAPPAVPLPAGGLLLLSAFGLLALRRGG